MKFWFFNPLPCQWSNLSPKILKNYLKYGTQFIDSSLIILQTILIHNLIKMTKWILFVLESSSARRPRKRGKRQTTNKWWRSPSFDQWSSLFWPSRTTIIIWREIKAEFWWSYECNKIFSSEYHDLVCFYKRRCIQTKFQSNQHSTITKISNFFHWLVWMYILFLLSSVH